ncbi:PWWP domain-containing protein 1 [Leucoagaricus sp. SymC.cos]|nr:PWWP domain-containing protein 1 [Leucoagaricus sp. SymC.cos]
MSKKAAKSAKEVSSYETRDIVLGKVRGYPPWPGMVVDPETVPGPVMKERPTTKKTHFYCVRFFPTGDYAWLVSKDISKLQPHEIQSYINEPYKKSGELLQGYRIAMDPTKWEEERDAEFRLAAEEEANAEVDQLDSENDGSGDGDDDDVKAKKQRKRKRESDAAAPTKAKKAPKKKDVGDGKKKSASAGGKGKKNGKRSNMMVESEEEDGDNVADDDGDAGPSKKGSPPPAKRARREKEDEGDDVKTSDPEAMKVRDWRHKLQKTFLSHKGLPKDEDMPSIDALFKTVENYDKITIEYLQFSKIGKVMRHIAVLDDDKVPRNDEYNFKNRADALVKKWQQILNANKPNGAASSGTAPAALASVISSGPISAAPGGVAREDTMLTDGSGSVSQGMAANGKTREVTNPGTESVPTSQPEPMSTDVPAPAASAQDVTMTEAA